MTPVGIASVALDTGMALVFGFAAVTVWKFQEERVRTRIATACIIVAVDLAGAAVLRLAGAGIPAWYIPIYGMVAPVAAYAGFLHVATLRVRMRVLREHAALVADELERYERARPVQVRQL